MFSLATASVVAVAVSILAPPSPAGSGPTWSPVWTGAGGVIGPGNEAFNAVGCGSSGYCVTSASGAFYSTRDVPLSFFPNGEGFGLGDGIGPAGGEDTNWSADALAVSSIACAGNDSCVGVGTLTLRSGRTSALVQSLTPADATGAPEGSTYFSYPAGNAGFTTVSCWAPGECLAGGYGPTPLGYLVAIVAVESDGFWNVEQVPGLPIGGVNSQTMGVACWAGGYCAIVGYVGDSQGGTAAQPFVALAHGSIIGDASVPAGMDLLDAGSAVLDAVACTRTGKCVAAGFEGWGNGSGGSSLDNAPGEPLSLPLGPAAFGAGMEEAPLVVDESDNTWGAARELTMPSYMGHGYLDSASCGGADCTVGGWSTCLGANWERDSCGPYSYMSAIYSNWVSGAWSKALAVRFPSSIHPQESDSNLTTLSCVSSSVCFAGGWISNDATARSADPLTQAFIAIEHRGSLMRASLVHGMTAPSEDSMIRGVACASPRRCMAVGSYIYHHRGAVFAVFSPPR